MNKRGQGFASGCTLLNVFFVLYATFFFYSVRWLKMIEECSERGIRIIGFPTDCDIRYLRAMRLITRFFATLPNISIRDDPNAFRVTIPFRSNWFFFDSVQKCLVFQVSVTNHSFCFLLSTELRR